MPQIYGASVSYLFTINLRLRQSGCRETETWGGGYLSQLPTLVAVQWLRLGSAEEEERAVMGLRGSRAPTHGGGRLRRLRRSDSAGLTINYRSQEESRNEERS